MILAKRINNNEKQFDFSVSKHCRSRKYNFIKVFKQFPTQLLHEKVDQNNVLRDYHPMISFKDSPSAEKSLRCIIFTKKPVSRTMDIVEYLWIGWPHVDN